MQKRIFAFDLIKALAIFFVVLYHMNIDLSDCMSEGVYSFSLSKYLYGILSSSVPLFFMVNGALMRGRMLSLKWCLIKSLRLIFIIIVWTAILRCGLLPWFLGRPQVTGVAGFFNFYWFLTTLALLYPITWFLQKCPIIKMVILSFLFVFPFVTNFYWVCRLYWNSDLELPNWGHTGVFTMYSLVYYYVGQYLVGFSERFHIKGWWPILLVLIGLLLVHFEVIAFSNHDHILYDGVNACFPSIGALLITSGIFLLLKDVKLNDGWIKKLLSDVGTNTLGVYIFHFFFIALIFEWIWDKVSIPLYLVFLEATLIVLLTTFISKIILKSPLKFLLKLN